MSTTETQAQHTPGPWRVGYSDETEAEALEHDTIVVTRVTNKLIPEEICEVPVPCFGEMPEIDVTFEARALADARLIAAAPDLLAALSKIIDAAEARYAEYGDEDHPDIATARAAIAKAEGA